MACNSIICRCRCRYWQFVVWDNLSYNQLTRPRQCNAMNSWNVRKILGYVMNMKEFCKISFLKCTQQFIQLILSSILWKSKWTTKVHVSFLSARPIFGFSWTLNTHCQTSAVCCDTLIMGGIYFTQILLLKLNLDTHDTLTLKILLIYQMTIETRNVCPSSPAAS